jgi:hypothetical protein
MLLLVALTLGNIISCSEKEVKGGEVVIRNDILDKQFNSFVVDQVVTRAGLTGYSKTIKPAEVVALPYRNIHSIRFSRQYEDHTKVYIIDCPDDLDTQIVIKLIDVHSNRLPGGCVLSKKGERGLNGVISWKK